MPPITRVENSGGMQQDLDNGPSTTAIFPSIAAQPLPVDYTNVEYSGTGLWPDPYYTPSTHDTRRNPTDVFQAQHWSNSPNQAPSSSTTLYNVWNAGGSLADVQHLEYSREGLVGQAEGRQSAQQDFHIPFSIPAPPDANEIPIGTSRTSAVSKPIDVRTTSPVAEPAQEKSEKVSDRATTSSSGSAARTAKKQSSSFWRMPPLTQSRGRRSDDGDSHAGARKISRDSARSDPEKREGDTTSVPFRADSSNNGGIRRSILRKNQVDAFEDFAGLPAEKGFPIQVLILSSLKCLRSYTH